MAKQEKSSAWKEYKDIRVSLKNGEISRVYLFTGEEKFLIDRIIKEFKDVILSPGAETIDFYAKDQTNSELSIDEFQSLAGSPPFLSKSRITVFKNTGWWSSRAPSTPKDIEAWKASIASVPEFATVLFIEDKVDKRKKQLIDTIAQNGVLADIGFMDEAMLSKWITNSLEKRKISISNDCVASIISRVDSSMRMIENEVQKLCLYCENKGISKIDMQLLDMLCISDVHASVFNMTDAIGMKRPDRALEILQDLVLLKEPIPKIRLMLARHIRQLICAKEIGDVSKTVSALKVQPFVARNLVNQSKGFTMTQLERIYNLCFESDSWVKNGKMEDRLSMEVLLAACGKV